MPPSSFMLMRGIVSLDRIFKSHKYFNCGMIHQLSIARCIFPQNTMYTTQTFNFLSEPILFPIRWQTLVIYPNFFQHTANTIPSRTILVASQVWLKFNIILYQNVQSSLINIKESFISQRKTKTNLTAYATKTSKWFWRQCNDFEYLQPDWSA